MATPCIPARRRIGGSYTTFIYDGGILMDVMGIISSITGAVSLYKTAVDTVDQAKIDAATQAINVQLISLGAEVLAMQQKELESAERERSLLREKNDLEDRVRELEKKISERERYELVDVHQGAFAYRLKVASADGEPSHYVCQGCLDNKSMKVVLQRQPSKLGRDAICPECKTEHWFNWFRA